MDKQKEQLSVEVARLYYQADLGQQEIATRLGVSRPTVSRLLQNAKTKGYVKIEVQDPFSNLTELAVALKEKYQLKMSPLHSVKQMIIAKSPSKSAKVPLNT